MPGFEDASTLAELFTQSAARFGARPMLGERPLLKVEQLESPRSGRKHERRAQGAYAWTSFAQAFEQASAFGAGLRALGLPRGSVVALFADTSPHWFLAAYGAFLVGLSVATVYTSLGAKGVEHALAGCGAAAVVTDAAGVRLLSATAAAADAPRIVLLPPRGADTRAADADAAQAKAALPEGKPVHTWSEALAAGDAADASCRTPPTAKDVALIMFTSGSTGTPKVRAALRMSNTRSLTTEAASRRRVCCSRTARSSPPWRASWSGTRTRRAA